MTFALKLSRRLAQGFLALGTAAALAACAGEPLSAPVDSNKPVSTVGISPSTASMGVHGTLQLSVVLQDAGGATLGGRTVTWASNAQKVATVSAAGLVQAADTGTATITASSEGKSASATVKVTLTAPATTPGVHAG